MKSRSPWTARSNALAARNSALAVALALTFSMVVAGGLWRLNKLQTVPQEFHMPQERLDRLNQIAQAVRPADEKVASPSLCPELDNVKHAFDERLAELTDKGIVQGHYELSFEHLAISNCLDTAKDINNEMYRSWAQFSIPDNWRENSTNKSETRWRGRVFMPNAGDVMTKNAWGTLPGCIRIAGIPIAGHCDTEAVKTESVQAIGDPMIATILAERLQGLAETSSGNHRSFRQKTTPVGYSARVELDPALQLRAYRLARCFTGDHTQCLDLPDHLRRDWHFQLGAIRTGAAGIVIVNIDTGGVVAAAGAVSDCSLTAMERRALSQDTRNGSMPLFSETNSLCAQFPDSRAAWLRDIPPIFWPIGPGSTMKTYALLAGIEAGVLPRHLDPVYQAMLATSHDPDGHRQEMPQNIALQAANHFGQLLKKQHFVGTSRDDVLLGGLSPNSGWWLPVRGGGSVESGVIDAEEYERILSAKRLGQNADKLFGPRAVAEYLKRYKFAIQAIGSGEIRTSAWALADWARQLALRADGIDFAPPMRLASVEAELPRLDLRFASPAAARRLLHLLGAATSSKLGGTAASACRIALDGCPPNGHPNVLAAKTGTSEVGVGGEASPFVKRGSSVPGKLFMAVIRGSDGHRYGVGAMSLRVRERPGSRLPELQSNSAAELAFLAAKPLFEKKREN